MTPDEINLTIAQYNDAILKLESYQAGEPDESKRAAASQQISDLRQKIIDLAWLGIVTRTEALNKLMTDLQAIIDNASQVSTLSGALNDLNDIVSQASSEK